MRVSVVKEAGPRAGSAGARTMCQLKQLRESNCVGLWAGHFERNRGELARIQTAAGQLGHRSNEHLACFHKRSWSANGCNALGCTLAGPPGHLIETDRPERNCVFRTLLRVICDHHRMTRAILESKSD